MVTTPKALDVLDLIAEDGRAVFCLEALLYEGGQTRAIKDVVAQR